MRCEGATNVGDGRSTARGEVDARHGDDDHGARAEAVVAVPLARVDVDPADVRGERRSIELHPTSGVASRVRLCEPVVGERQRAAGLPEEVATSSERNVDRRFPRDGRGREPATLAATRGTGRGHQLADPRYQIRGPKRRGPRPRARLTQTVRHVDRRSATGRQCDAERRRGERRLDPHNNADGAVGSELRVIARSDDHDQRIVPAAR